MRRNVCFGLMKPLFNIWTTVPKDLVWNKLLRITEERQIYSETRQWQQHVAAFLQKKLAFLYRIK